MSEPQDEPKPPETDDQPDKPWDPVQIMKERAAATRRDRDRSIAELRERMSDDEILDDFGINLDELGD